MAYQVVAIRMALSDL